MAEIAVKRDETCCTQGNRRSSESFQVIQLVDILSDIPRHFVADDPVWITCILLYSMIPVFIRLSTSYLRDR